MAQSNLARKFEEDDSAEPGQGAVKPATKNPHNFKVLPGGGEGSGEPSGDLKAVAGSLGGAVESETPSITGKADPMQGAAQAAARDLKGPQTVAWILVGFIGGAAIITSVFSLGLFIPGQIFLLSCLFISPKWTYKAVLGLLSLAFGPEVYKYGQYVDPNDIKLTTTQRVIIAMEVVVLGLVMVLEVFLVMNVVCRSVDTGPRAFTFFVSRGADFFSGSNLPSSVRDACVKLNDFVSGQVSKLAGGTGNYYSGPISIGAWKDAINQSSQKYNIDPCVMVVILKKESRGGDPNAIGHDAHDGRQDPFQLNSSPLYGLDWKYSHGIGIAQLTIYTPNQWPISGIPSRTWFGTNYTIPDFLNPTLSIDIAAHYMADNIRRENGDLRDAFRDYNGRGPRAEAYGDASMLLYDQCKIQGF